MTYHYDQRLVTACQSHCELVLQIAINETVRFYSDGVKGHKFSCWPHKGLWNSAVDIHTILTRDNRD